MAVRADSTVGALKEVVARRCDVPPARQQSLIYKGRIMRDDQTLQSYGLQAEHTVHMFCGFPSSGSPSTANTVRVGGRINGRATAGGATPGAATSANFSFLGGNRNLGAGVPELEQMQQQLTQNPDLMREMMSMPAVRSLMNNPDLMRTIIMSNPQTRDLIDRNPELADTFNDPAIMTQTLETARNPQLMREMMRNTDRAMSNIESTPERFNMLRRMYENVQVPFFNVMVSGGGNGIASKPFAALLGNQGLNTARTGSNVPNTVSGSTATGTVPNSNSLPNPWGRPQVNTSTRTRSRSSAPRTAAAGGLRGRGFPDVGAFRMPVAAQMNRMLQNPATSQMIGSSLLSNPQYINQLLNFNPQMRTMLHSNPQLREMMQNPEFLRQLTSPRMMLQMMTLQQSPLHSLDQQQGARSAGQAGDAAGLEALMNVFVGLETGRLNVPNTPAVSQDELYSTQLSQLQEMGFSDTQANIRALQATSGNVHAALERLLNNLDQ